MIDVETPWALLVALPLLYLYWRLGRGAREVRALRLLIVLLIALALASPTLRSRRRSRSMVLLVDRSLSCGREAMARAGEMADLMNRSLTLDDRMSVVTFGRDALALSRRGALAEMGSATPDDASNLAGGLALAGSLLAGREGGRVFVISDGLYTGRDPMEAVPALHKAGVAVDYSPILREDTADVAVTEVHTPERVQQGHPFEVSFTVQSPVSTQAMVRVQRPGMDTSQEVALSAGANTFNMRDRAGAAGLMRYTVSVAVEGDARPENNRALAVTHSVGAPTVLVVNQQGSPDNVTRALEAGGLAVTIATPGMPFTSADLKPYVAVVLENVAVSSLGDRADGAVRNFVRELGGGLLVTGGRRSYAAGGYYQSRLEEVLPVSMMRKEEYSRPKVAMGIVLDRSGSMGMTVPGGQTKMQLADRAAAEAVGVLLPQDEITAFAVDSMAHKVVGLTIVGGNREKVARELLSVESGGGGIFVYTGLRAAVGELMNSSARTRHILLFSDAADSEEPGDYKNLVDRWVAAGGSISVVGLGTDRDVDSAFLIDIARRANGEVFFTTDAEALPRVFCQDVIRIARETFLEQPTGAVVRPQIVELGELGIRTFPDFLGYNLCYTKEDAAELVTTTDDNKAPVVATRQSGMGRVAAITCEVDGTFTGPLRTWEDFKPFVVALVKWSERPRDDVSLFGTITRAGRTATVSLEMDAAAARGATGAAALIIPPGEGEPERIPLRWVGPRQMEADFRLDSDGIYHGIVLTNEGRRVSLPPVVLPYSPEFEPKPSSAGLATLEELAEATGGGRVMHVRELLASSSAYSHQPVSAAPAAAGLLLVLLLCDIVTRKHLWGILVPAFLKRGYARTSQGLVSTAGRVRRRLRRSRRQRDDAPKPPSPAEQAPPEPEPPAPKKKESVFARAKRRARGGGGPSDQ